VGASAKQEEAGLALHGAGGGLCTAAARNRGRSWRKEKRAILQFLKIPGTKL